VVILFLRLPNRDLHIETVEKKTQCETRLQKAMTEIVRLQYQLNFGRLFSIVSDAAKFKNSVPPRLDFFIQRLQAIVLHLT
jgi:hypothetical protein